MLKILTSTEVDALMGYLSHEKNPHQNLHARVTRTKGGKASLLCLFGMKEIDGEVHCGLGGPAGELDFVLMDDGTVDVTYSTLAGSDAEEKVLKRIGTAVRRRLQEGFPEENYPAIRTPGEFYLQRWDGATVTSAARAAVAARQLTDRFVRKMAAFNLRVIRGRKRKPKPV